ncbi:MAG: hypothetical protein MUF87_20005 [Anaerolineae bacterium]|nr:hypothetical protein [Anaerolineae bacterium]
MNITDVNTLKQISPDYVRRYLAKQGWSQIREWKDKATIWGHDEDQNLELIVPNHMQFADYALRISEILTTLAQHEQRLQTAIYAEMLNSDEDILRIRAFHPDSEDGSIPLIDGVHLLQATHDLLLSAATVVDRKRLHLPTRKPKEAVNYLEQVRIGQTERGSYVLVIQSPTVQTVESPSNVPFGRRVLQTLADTLITLQTLEQQVNVEQSGEAELEDASQEFVNQGGSYELCEALEELNRSVKEQLVGISFSWSSTEIEPLLTSQEIMLTPKMTRLTQRIGQTLRRTWLTEEKTIVGSVIRLVERDLEYTSVSIDGEIEGQRKRVRLHIKKAEDRELVIHAFRSKLKVRCRGILERIGNYTLLDKYEDLQIVNNDPV